MEYHKRPRAKFYSYNEGDFFVTVCTMHMVHRFGSVVDGQMVLTPIGLELDKSLNEISKHMPDVEIPLHVVMPNHFHAIVTLNGSKEGGKVNSGRLNYLARIATVCGESPSLATHHDSRLAVAMGSVKAYVTRFANQHNIPFGWHERFHDHGIRNRYEGSRIAYYIEHNPETWDTDCFNIPPKRFYK